MEKEMSRTLAEIKVGDRVWISAKWGGSDKGEIKTVKRLTSTQIILDGQYEQYNRYQRGKKSRYGDELTYYGIGRSDGRITGIATRDECARWDAEQDRKRQAQAEAEAQRKADKALCAELQSLLPEKASVSGPYRNTWGEWRINIYATEAEVREVATRLQGILAAPGEVMTTAV